MPLFLFFLCSLFDAGIFLSVFGTDLWPDIGSIIWLLNIIVFPYLFPVIRNNHDQIQIYNWQTARIIAHSVISDPFSEQSILIWLFCSLSWNNLSKLEIFVSRLRLLIVLVGICNHSVTHNHSLQRLISTILIKCIFGSNILNKYCRKPLHRRPLRTGDQITDQVRQVVPICRIQHHWRHSPTNLTG